jgi:DNA-directed RNA polymerase III subunit RPC8
MLKTEDNDELYLDLDDEVFFSSIVFLFIAKQILLPQITAHTKLMIYAITVQIRFLVSGTKYPPIPIEQKADDPPFSPMQIVVRTVSCIHIVHMPSLALFIFMNDHF